jgi:hypothetical protein
MATLRATVIQMMDLTGDETIRQQAFEKVMDFASKSSVVSFPGDLQKVIFQVGSPARRGYGF